MLYDRPYEFIEGSVLVLVMWASHDLIIIIYLEPAPNIRYRHNLFASSSGSSTLFIVSLTSETATEIVSTTISCVASDTRSYNHRHYFCQV